jgi:chaperonin cofactor prefoldin
MPQLERDLNSGAVIIKYNEHELEDHLGYRLTKLEKRFDVLEKKIEELEVLVKKVIEKFYI